MIDLPQGKQLVLYDATCKLCDSTIQYIIAHDQKDLFRFCSLESERGKKILKYIGTPKTLDSIVLYIPGEAYYVKLEAVTNIMKELNSPLRYLAFLSILGRFGNFIYDQIAKNRIKVFGNKTSCMLPTEDIKKKFLDM